MVGSAELLLLRGAPLLAWARDGESPRAWARRCSVSRSLASSFSSSVEAVVTVCCLSGWVKRVMRWSGRGERVHGRRTSVARSRPAGLRQALRLGRTWSPGRQRNSARGCCGGCQQCPCVGGAGPAYDSGRRLPVPVFCSSAMTARVCCGVDEYEGWGCLLRYSGWWTEGRRQ